MVYGGQCTIYVARMASSVERPRIVAAGLLGYHRRLCFSVGRCIALWTKSLAIEPSIDMFEVGAMVSRSAIDRRVTGAGPISNNTPYLGLARATQGKRSGGAVPL